MNQKFTKLPGVLSFQRLMIISDGAFSNINDKKTPIYVERHGILGTQNTIEGKENVANPQITETAKTDLDSSGLSIDFKLKFIQLEKALFACSGNGDDVDDLRQSILNFCRKSYTSLDLEEVSRRYARNILNARWVWRNRVLAQTLKVNVMYNNKEMIRDYNAFNSSLNDFNNYTQEENDLGFIIKNMLSGSDNGSLSIRASIDFGFKGAVEVFPSQNYLDGKKPQGFARPLYKIGTPEKMEKILNREISNDFRKMGQAALRDQKIGNALRTIDTWFADFNEIQTPIAVEPVGANIAFNKFFRENKKNTSFDILKNVNLLNQNSDEWKFLIASIIRGGVYSESDKEFKEEKKKTTKKNKDDINIKDDVNIMYDFKEETDVNDKNENDTNIMDFFKEENDINDKNENDTNIMDDFKEET